MLDHRCETTNVAPASAAVSRRGLFRITAATAFLFGFRLPLGTESRAAEAGTFAPNAFIRIDAQGDITLIMPQVEMGQGVYTSLSMILAEELDAEWSRVKFEHAPADEALYKNPMLGMQATGNSNSVRAFWKPMREAAAGARAMLVQAAAAQMGVGAGELRTEDSQV